MARYALQVMYDGTLFHGSQLQHQLPTVQLAINNALSMLFRTPIASYGASRTDEGVHATCNYYHFDLEADIKPNIDPLYRLNAILPTGVCITRFQRTTDSFNARFDAISRRYRYRIYHTKNPFLVKRAMFLPFRIDRQALDQTATILTQYTQFESFAKRRGQSATFNCTIKDSHWEDHANTDGELHYIVEANRFLRGMVRGLVATQLEVAKGKHTIDEFRQIIEVQDCTKAFFDAPGQGLYLEHIEYPESCFV